MENSLPGFWNIVLVRLAISKATETRSDGNFDRARLSVAAQPNRGQQS